MLRIPVTPRKPDGAGDHTTLAPYLTGILRYKGAEIAGQLFMIDTGADATLVRYGPHDAIKGAYREGDPTLSRGVGGFWPARDFRDNWELVVEAEEGESGKLVPLCLKLPQLTIMAPYGRYKGHKLVSGSNQIGSFHFEEAERLPSIPPSTRPAIASRTLEPFCDAPDLENLLGRDVFRANNLRLDWRPHGPAWIVQLDSKEVVATPAAATNPQNV